MNHILNNEHREHLLSIGIDEAPQSLDISQAEYERHYALWQKTLPHAGHPEWHKRALAHSAWKEYNRPQATGYRLQVTGCGGQGTGHSPRRASGPRHAGAFGREQGTV